MATKTKTDTTSMITDSTKALEDASVKIQEQYFTMLEQSQTAVLDGLKVMFGVVAKIDIPAVPGLDNVLPDFDATTVPNDMLNGAFEFASKMLENQKEFTSKVLAVSAKA